MLSKSMVKYIQSLGQKKFRDEEGVFIAEGPKIIKELLEAKDVELQKILAVKEWIDENKQALSNFPLHVVTGEELDRMSQLNEPNQVLAVVKKFSRNEKVNTENQIILVLDTIQDPGNLGSIIRIADWFGVMQIICSHDCADMYNPKVVQASMGSIVRVKIIYVDLLNWLGDQTERRIYAGTLEGRNVSEMNSIGEGIIIIGNESRGIRSEILELANVKITIPRIGRAESLNAAVATGIILSHLKKLD